MSADADQRLLPDQTMLAAMSSASDEELLLYISCQEPEDLPSANAAFEVFHQRHAGYLYVACKRYGGIAGRVGVEDLVQNTFLHVWEYAAGRFGTSPEADEEDLRRRTRAWLGKIAKRLFLDLLRQEPPDRHLTLEGFDEHEAIPELERDGPALARLKAAVVHELGDRERDIVLVSMEYAAPDGTLHRLPEEVLTYLEKRWSTTRENIRQIRRRALAKLRRALEDYEK